MAVVLDPSTLSYSEFVKRFMLSGRPVLIKGLCADWGANQQWTTDGLPDFAKLKRLPDVRVPVVHSSGGDYQCSEMNLHEFLCYWERRRDAAASSDEPEIYLKDWHYVEEILGGEGERRASLYPVPVYFEDDWFNKYGLKGDSDIDDFRFVYWGPRGTCTPVHMDVLGSFSWSANICGRKRWRFFRPEHSHLLRDRSGLQTVTHLDCYDTSAFPHVRTAPVVDVVQEAGDCVFVPSGWHHQVDNLDDCMSINHNWADAANIREVLRVLLADLRRVEGLLASDRGLFDTDVEYTLACQRIVHANNGVDLYGFVAFLLRCVSGEMEAHRALGNGDDASVSKVERAMKLLSLYRLGHLLATLASGGYGPTRPSGGDAAARKEESCCADVLSAVRLIADELTSASGAELQDEVCAMARASKGEAVSLGKNDNDDVAPPAVRGIEEIWGAVRARGWTSDD